MEKTPIEVLEKEIESFKRLQKMIETEEGMYIDPEKKDEIRAKLSAKHLELTNKIHEFEQAIKLLKKRQPLYF